jgi:dsDNA-binding SOS-regulon protein
MKLLKFNLLVATALMSLSQGACVASNDEEQRSLSFQKSIKKDEIERVLKNDSVDELIQFGKSVRTRPEINSQDYLLFIKYENKNILAWAKKFNSQNIITYVESLLHSHNIVSKTLSFLNESDPREIDPREALYDNMANKENEIRNLLKD